MVVPFVICGVGMTLFFVPAGLGGARYRSRRRSKGVASGANAAFRELGGVLGIAVLGAVFSSNGGYASVPGLRGGLVPAVDVGRRGAGRRVVALRCRAVARRVRQTWPRRPHRSNRRPHSRALGRGPVSAPDGGFEPEPEWEPQARPERELEPVAAAGGERRPFPAPALVTNRAGASCPHRACPDAACA